MVYYMSDFFFENFMHMECYIFSRAFAFFDVMLSKMAIIFGSVDPDYHFRPERLTLDILLWDLFNFNIFYGWSHISCDFSFLEEIFLFDTLSFQRTFALSHSIENMLT